MKCLRILLPALAAAFCAMDGTRAIAADGEVIVERLDEERIAVSLLAERPLAALRALAREFAFELSLPEGIDEGAAITKSLSGRPDEVIFRLLPDYNLILRTGGGSGEAAQIRQVIVLESKAGSGPPPLAEIAPRVPPQGQPRPVAAGQSSGPDARPAQSATAPLQMTPEMLSRIEQQRREVLRRLGQAAQPQN